MKVKVMGSNLGYLLKSSLLYKRFINSKLPSRPQGPNSPKSAPNHSKSQFLFHENSSPRDFINNDFELFQEAEIAEKNFGKTHDDMIRTMNCSMKLVAFFATICRILGQKTMLKLEQVSRYSNNFRFRSYCQNSSNCCGHNYDQSISRIFRSNFDENNRFKVITYVPKDIQFKKINLRGTMRTLRFLSLLSAR